ncbi:hypothetical protein [Mesorhizobium kowhaii]|uniref:hypothetical protein n=1 Tax=Mesorhizobium kowhaii TaxID=1300272 RepID=UPI001FDEBEEB|nr:hypothetical protein [Mesorhizobium kowhaii]
MKAMNRRSAIAFGLTTVAASPLFTLAASAKTKKYDPKEGKEIAPGVRVVEVGTGTSDIPAYKSISSVDVVFQPTRLKP